MGSTLLNGCVARNAAYILLRKALSGGRGLRGLTWTFTECIRRQLGPSAHIYRLITLQLPNDHSQITIYQVTFADLQLTTYRMNATFRNIGGGVTPLELSLHFPQLGQSRKRRVIQQNSPPSTSNSWTAKCTQEVRQAQPSNFSTQLVSQIATLP